MSKNNNRFDSEFSRKTIQTLRDRVNGICSNSACRKPTVGPSTIAEKIVTLRKACHITAAAPGGPRSARLRQNDACDSTVGNGVVEGEPDGRRDPQPQPS